MNSFYSDSKTYLKLRCDECRYSSHSMVPNAFLVDWRLFVACYYPTTPTDYPSTTRGTSVGPPVAVNIDFCGYLRFLSISGLNYTDTVRHWHTFWATTIVPFIGQCWYFNAQWTARPAINNASCVGNGITRWNNCAVAMCRHMNRGIWRGLGGGGGPFWLHRETLTFKVPAAYQNTAVFQIGVNNIPPKFDTHCDVYRSRSTI